MSFETANAPHALGDNNVTETMRKVIYALIPGTLAYGWYFGSGIFITLAIAIIVSLASEAAVLKLRNYPVKPALSDGSALVTAWLLALALPPLAPWWLTTLGCLFAIVVAKQLYGGLGFNPFNPAMVGYVVLIISFPREMTLWTPPMDLAAFSFSPLETAQIIFTGNLPEGATWDAVTLATPLNTIRTQLGQNLMLSEVWDNPLFGTFGGHGWEWLGNFFMIGGLWLIYTKVVDWRIPFGMLGTLVLISTWVWAFDPDSQPAPLFHMFSGGAMLAAFFIATDPVTAPSSAWGRLIYGGGIGVLIYIIRSWGGYPDGVAFAVLLMNMAAPAIDHYVRPRAFGQADNMED